MLKKFYADKKVLITGDTGFKGSWLSLWLLKLGAKVYGYALPPRSERDNYVVTNSEKYIEHFDGDIRDNEYLNTVTTKIKPDIIFHLAAQPIVLESYKDPITTFSTNVMGTANVLESARQVESVKVIINVTTDKVYKNKEWHWGYRETDELSGSDPYSTSKACSELVTSSFRYSFSARENGPELITARAGNVIGAGDWADYRIVPDFFRSYSKNETLVIRNPESTRPWQHVLEPLFGYLLLAYNGYKYPGKYNDSWNLGPDIKNNSSVKTLITELGIQTGFTKVELNKSLDENSKESKLLHLDNSKAIKLLGWKPVWNFSETVKMTASGYMSDLSQQNAESNRLDTIDLFSKSSEKLNIKAGNHK